MKELKSKLSDLNTAVENLENQLDRQKQYSHRNCIPAHGIAEPQGQNNDDICLGTINEHVEVELTQNELDHNHRIGNRKLGNKRPRPIIVNFVRYSTKRKVFVNKKRLKYT